MQQEAKKYAFKANEDQSYGEKPYTYHLSKVVEVLDRFGCRDATVISAAWLHDTIEDTEASLQDLQNLFGEEVSDLVFRVSSEEGKNRKERFEKTYPKIRARRNAVLVKLADRIANVESCLETNKALYKMYKKEYARFREALFKPGEFDDMWDHLDDLFSE